MLHRLALLSLCCAACAGTSAEVRPDGPEVKDIQIQGADKLSASDIKKKILTSESGLGFPPFANKSYFDPNAWQADLRRIERYYQAQGYYQAEVVEDEVTPRGPDGVALKVKVKEGEPTRVSTVTLTGVEQLPAEQQKAVRKGLTLHEGDVFQEDDWAGQKAALQSILKEKGYADGAVEGEVHVDVTKRTAEVMLEAHPGQRYRFGNVFVSNDPTGKVNRLRIEEQAKGAIKPGDWYSESAISEAQARVFKMGVFGGVKVNRAAPDRSNGTVPVVVDVREAPFHTQKLGFGLGIDPTRNEARVTGEYTDRNFFGDLRRFTARGRLGYALLPNVVDVLGNVPGHQSGPVGNLQAEVEQPRFLFRDVRGQASVSVERDLQQAYNYIGGRLRLGAIWQPFPELSIYPSYNTEVYRLSGTVLPNGTVPPLVLGCRPDVAAPNAPCNLALSYLEQTVEWDRRDDRTEPRKGFYLALSLQEGGGPLQGSFDFIRVLPDARFYTSFFDERLTLAVKLRVGTLIPGLNHQTGLNQDSPIVSRFFSGGSSMRGFYDRRLSPMDIIPSQDPVKNPFGQTVPIGGNGLFEGTVELRYAVTPSLVVAAFLDTGFVTSSSFDFADPGYVAKNMQYAVGVGLRYLTLVGPIRLDLATRLAGPPLLNPAQLDPGLTSPLADVHRGCFFGLGERRDQLQPGTYGGYASYAGSPEGLCAFHISIGEAF